MTIHALNNQEHVTWRWKVTREFLLIKENTYGVGIRYKKIDVCLDDCMLYYKEDEEKKECSIYSQPLFKHDMEDDAKQSNVPYKVLCYFALTHRLQWLYMLSKIARHMQWHKEGIYHDPTIVSHPIDGEA